MLHDHLAEAARRVPDTPAVRFRTRELSYAELYRDADALARSLIAAGVRAGDRVGLWLPKGIEAVTAVHGVLLAGAAYVPVDPASPPARARHILGDCAMSGLVVSGDNVHLLGDEVWGLDSLRLIVVVDGQDSPSGDRAIAPRLMSWASALHPVPAAAVMPPRDPEALAYILYTSGSTGAPKGVMLSHANGDVVARWACDRLGFRVDDRIASHAPLHFDLSVIDVFGAACAGATLVLVPDHQRAFGPALARFIVRERITVWYSVPGALIALLDAGESALDGASLRVVLYAGEAFPVPRLAELMRRLPGAQVHNLYGPTETNVCTWHRVTAAEVAAPSVPAVPIGRLCDYARGWLLDDDGRTVDIAPGRHGELVVAGASVMLGYWPDGRHTDTAARRGSAGERRHRTGDLTHVDEAGDLVFDRRLDDMVKIRGYRVEPAEVEAALHAAAGVSDACVVAAAGADGATRLDAYVVPRHGLTLDVAELRRACVERLPGYMVPSTITVLAELPRGSTGKVDRRALPDLAAASAAVAS